MVSSWRFPADVLRLAAARIWALKHSDRQHVFSGFPEIEVNKEKLLLSIIRVCAGVRFATCCLAEIELIDGDELLGISRYFGYLYLQAVLNVPLVH